MAERERETESRNRRRRRSCVKRSAWLFFCPRDWRAQSGVDSASHRRTLQAFVRRKALALAFSPTAADARDVSNLKIQNR